MPQNIRVHRNSRERVWIVKRDGNRVERAVELLLYDCRFSVNPAGSRRAKELGIKNAHAFVYGRVLDMEPPAWSGRYIAYDPLADETFVYCDSRQPALREPLVRLTADGRVIAFGEEPERGISEAAI